MERRRLLGLALLAAALNYPAPLDLRANPIKATRELVIKTLTEDQKNSKVADSGQLGLKGNRIPYVAKLNASASVQYSHPVSAQATGMLRLNYTYTGTSHTQFRPDYINNDQIGGFGQLNLRTGVEVSDWEAYLFVNNVFDTIGIYDTTSNRPYVDARVLTQAPREVGINLRKSF